MEDVRYNLPGGVVFYGDHIKFPSKQSDLVFYPMPVKDLIKQAKVPRNLQDYMENMVYVGIVAEVLGINLEVVKGALLSQFHNNTSVAESNFEIVLLAGEWAKHNLSAIVIMLSPCNHLTITS